MAGRVVRTLGVERKGCRLHRMVLSVAVVCWPWTHITCMIQSQLEFSALLAAYNLDYIGDDKHPGHTCMKSFKLILVASV
jgi:hypothetical protein